MTDFFDPLFDKNLKFKLIVRKNSENIRIRFNVTQYPG